jgi:hypothetical protein
MSGKFQSLMQSKATCTIGWTWRPWCSYVGLFLGVWSKCNGLAYHLQHLKKYAKPTDTSIAQLIVFCLQIKHFFLPYIYIYIMFEMVCNQMYMVIDIFFFKKMSRDTLYLKLNFKWKFSNIHTTPIPWAWDLNWHWIKNIFLFGLPTNLGGLYISQE